MLSKILNAINNIGVLPKTIIKCGISLCSCLMICGVAFYLNNQLSPGFSLREEFVSVNMIKSAVIIFAEVVIGGLMFETYVKRHDSG